MHYYSFNIGDYRKDTAHLNLIEHGVYRQLVDWYYLDEAPLPSDIKKLSRMISARSDLEVEALQNVLADFFQLTDVGYIHERCDIELKAIYDKSEKARNSAQKRWDKKANSNANASKSNANAPKLDAKASKSDATGMLPINPLTQYPRQKKKSTVKLQATLTIETIFDFWRKTLNHNRAKLDDARKKIIRKALRDGYSETDLLDAITGCSMSEWHMGKNNRSTKFDSLGLILKSSDNIDKFIAIKTQGGARAGRDAEIDAISQSAVDEFVGGGNMIEGEVVNG